MKPEGTWMGMIVALVACSIAAALFVIAINAVFKPSSFYGTVFIAAVIVGLVIGFFGQR